jgi:hypothetical protein
MKASKIDDGDLTKAMIVRAIIVYLVAIAAILLWTRLAKGALGAPPRAVGALHG